MSVIYVDRDDETAVRILIADVALAVRGKGQPDRLLRGWAREA